jgi:hypothetical protein
MNTTPSARQPNGAGQAGGPPPAYVPVQFRITTYWKRRRNEPGLTQMASERLAVSQALDWVLGELPADAVAIGHDQETDLATVIIDWGKVPDEIRYGRRP